MSRAKLLPSFLLSRALSSSSFSSSAAANIYRDELEKISAAGLFKHEREMTGPTGPKVTVRKGTSTGESARPTPSVLGSR